MNHFSSAVSWDYDYGHRIQKAEQLAWINANIEFVPMVHGFRVDWSKHARRRLHELLPHADQGGQPGRRAVQRRAPS